MSIKRVTLLVTTFNSLTQKTWVYLRDRGYIVDVVYAINPNQMVAEVEAFKPDIIFSPFLKRFIPEEIFLNYPTFVLHPGPIGDKGAYALENAVFYQKKEWGVIIFQATKEFDSGDIFSHQKFTIKSRTKSSIYRNELSESAFTAIERFFENYPNLERIKQPSTPLHKPIRQKDIKINWEKDSNSEILKKIDTLDSFPGVRDNILGIEVELFGAWEEGGELKETSAKPKSVIAKRDGAICLKTLEGAIWISHLKEPHRFKLPATYVLKDRLKGIKENRTPLIIPREIDPEYQELFPRYQDNFKTFYEISCDIKGDIAYLHFNFLNGAFRAEQSIRLKYTIEFLKEHTKAIVLMGGEQFFSNGINLNILEDSQKQGEDGWSNINAINELIESILFASNVITVASLSKNSGAGGVFLATACDFVVSTDGVVLNPHYKTIGLSGSEYHSYTLPKRVGDKVARELLDNCLPISSSRAKEIGLVDKLLNRENYLKELEEFAQSRVEDDFFDQFIWDKEEYLEENMEYIKAHKERELKVMYPEFWDSNSSFHRLRREFVYKLCPTKTPKRLKAKI